MRKESELINKLKNMAPIHKDGKQFIPYCELKNKACYESVYWDKCKNFKMYEVYGKD